MIYAVNMRTKEHCEWNDALAHTDDWIARRADADGWIEWDGGVCPLPDDCAYEIKMRNGIVERWADKASAHNTMWLNESDPLDIIAYRPILDAKPRTPTPERGTDATTPRRPFLYSGRLRERFGPFDVSPPAWDGEGLPPVGCECEVLHDGEWVGCEVIAHYRPCSDGPMVAVYAYAIEDGRKVAQKIKSQFRPLRSEEDKAVVAIARILADEFDATSEDCVDAARALYRAGYRKTATADGEDV